MMRWIVLSSLKFRLLVVTVSTAIMVFGLTQLRYVPVDTYPEFAPPYVEVQVESLGLSAAEVEALVTVPIESGFLSTMPWLEEIRSKTYPGMTSIVLEFKPGTNFLHARQMVQDRLTQAHTLPDASRPPVMLQPVSSNNRVMKIGLTSDEYSLLELSMLGFWKIKPRLMDIPGVAQVAIWGQREQQIQVQVNPEQLRDNGVKLMDIVKTAGDATWVTTLPFMKASSTGTGGWIDTPQQRIGVRHVSPISVPDHLAEVTIEGSMLRLGDVADVVVGHQPLVGDAVVNGEPGVLLMVERFPWANTLEVTREIEKALTLMRPGLTGIELDSEIYRPATFIETAMSNLNMVLLVGLLLVLAMVFAFVHEWRIALISFVAIVMSVLVAGFVLFLTGTTFDMMIIAGLVVALGAIIDEAVIDVDNIRRRLQTQQAAGGDPSMANIVFTSILEMRRAIVFALLVCVLAVAPFLLMGGIAGALLAPLAISFIVAVVAAMVVALTLTPALSLLLFPDGLPARRESLLVGGLQRVYAAVFAKAVGQPRAAFTSVAAVAAAALLAFPFLVQDSLRPTFKENSLLVDWKGAPGTSYVEMSRRAKEAGDALQAIPGVSNVSAHVGRAFNGDQVVGIHESQLWITLEPAADYDATVAAIEAVMDDYPGTGPLLTHPEKRMLQVDQERGISDDLVVRVYGHELDILRRKAEDVQQVLGRIAGIADAHVAYPVEEPNVEIEVDLEAAKQHAVKPGEVRRAAAIVLSGYAVGHYYDKQKAYEVVVWGKPETRESVNGIGDMLVDTPSGVVRMDEVADVRLAPAPVVINREKVSRYMDVIAKVKGRSRVSVAAEVKQRIEAINYPVEYHAEVRGAFVEARADRNRILSIFVAAAIGVYLLLQASFGSWRLAAVALVTLPMALSGSIVAAMALGGLSLGPLLGLLAVFAIAVRQSLMLIKHYQHLAQHEDEVFGPALVLRGTRERLGPIMLTTLATAVLVLPMVLFGNAAGLEIMSLMAVVLLAGLVTTVLYILVGVAALYLLFGAGAEPDAVEL